MFCTISLYLRREENLFIEFITFNSILEKI